MRRRTRVGIEPAAVAGRRRNRPIAREPMGPVLVSGFQSLLDEQAAKAGAVDEQLAFYHPAVVQLHGFNKAVFGALSDVDDLPLDATDPGAFGVAAQESRVEPRVEMKRVEHLIER